MHAPTEGMKCLAGSFILLEFRHVMKSFNMNDFRQEILYSPSAQKFTVEFMSYKLYFLNAYARVPWF